MHTRINHRSNAAHHELRCVREGVLSHSVSYPVLFSSACVSLSTVYERLNSLTRSQFELKSGLCNVIMIGYASLLFVAVTTGIAGGGSLIERKILQESQESKNLMNICLSL